MLKTAKLQPKKNVDIRTMLKQSGIKMTRTAEHYEDLMNAQRGAAQNKDKVIRVNFEYWKNHLREKRRQKKRWFEIRFARWKQRRQNRGSKKYQRSVSE